MFSSHPSKPGVSASKADYVFFFPDTLETAVDFLIPIHAKRDAVDVSQLVVKLQVAPVGRDVVVGFYKQGVLIGSVTVTDGTKTGTTDLDPYVRFEAEDEFTIKILQTGLSVVGSTLTAYGRISA